MAVRCLRLLLDCQHFGAGAEPQDSKLSKGCRSCTCKACTCGVWAGAAAAFLCVHGPCVDCAGHACFVLVHLSSCCCVWAWGGPALTILFGALEEHCCIWAFLPLKCPVLSCPVMHVCACMKRGLLCRLKSILSECKLEVGLW